jgi:regulatory protein
VTQAASITAIVPDARKPRLSAVKVGRRTVATLSQRSIDRLGLAVGREWDEALASQVAAAATFERWLHRAGRWLDRRAMTRRPVSRKLAAEGCDETTAAEVMDRLAELGLIDDAALARVVVEQMKRRGPVGSAKLRAALVRRGVEDSVIEQVVGEACPGASAAESARELARRKLQGMANLDQATQARRLSGLLARRGFDEETVRDVVEGLVDEG